MFKSLFLSYFMILPFYFRHSGIKRTGSTQQNEIWVTFQQGNKKNRTLW